MFEGVVEDVPSLKAPGFCFARTSTFLHMHQAFGDASNFTSLEITYKAPIAYKGFKAAFVADTLDTQFGSFKADFAVEATTGDDYASIDVPFSR